jgi:hypothetical protein
MVAQLLAHIDIDTLDAALEKLSQRIELVLTPHHPILELLCPIPGVQSQPAQVLIAECGLDMSYHIVPDRVADNELGPDRQRKRYSPSTAPGAPSANSRPSATTSRSNQPNPPNKPPDTTHTAQL